MLAVQFPRATLARVAGEAMTRLSRYGPVLSLGAGVQSTTLLLLAAEGALPPLVAAVFADTGWEPKAVYDHLDRLEREVAEPAGIPIIRVQWGNLRTDAIEGHRWLKMPVFVLSPQGKRGQSMRQCTKDYKIDPIKRKLRELMGAKISASGAVLSPPADTLMEQWIGISRDEFHRAKSADEKWLVNRFPLLDMNWTRQDCLTYLDERGWESTPKSACIGCPYHGNRMWRDMQNEAPEEFADAVEFDRQLRSGEVRGGDRLRGQPYLHRDCVPLAEVDLRPAAERNGQGELFVEEGDPDGCSPWGCRGGEADLPLPESLTVTDDDGEAA